MWLAALILLQVPAATDVAVQPLSGAPQKGVLLELNDDRIAVDVDGEKRTYNVRDILKLVVREAGEPLDAESGVYIQLVDGSLLAATGYRVQDGVAEIQLGGRTASIQTRNIHTVRFHGPSDALAAQWQEITTAPSKSDIIVLRRSATALDQLEGVFHDVTDDEVEFEFDDTRHSVKRTKLEGLFYYHRAGRDLPDPVCAIVETNGTNWRARSIELQDGQLQVVTLAGTKCRVPWDAVARLDFSSINVAYLGDLDFELVECTPYVASKVAAKRILQLYAPRRDSSFSGKGLWLANEDQVQQFDKGLALHSRSLVVYRLNEPYRKLTAVVGIDSRLQGRGDLVLVIEGDNKELLRRSISGKDDPYALDLNIEGVRRLKILVDYGTSLDVADHLNLCNARIIK